MTSAFYSWGHKFFLAFVVKQLRMSDGRKNMLNVESLRGILKGEIYIG